MLEPSYNDLKFTIRHHNYVCSSPISRRGIFKVDFRRGGVQRSASGQEPSFWSMEQQREQRAAHVSVARGLVCSVQEGSCGYDTSCIGELGLQKSEGGCIKVLATWKGTGEARAERLSKKATFKTKVDSAVVAWWISGNCHAKTSQLYNQKIKPNNPSPSKKQTLVCVANI